MSKRLTDEERADLVAYLDGELAGEDARAVEARISLDPATRAEAESLKRTWDLLDFLPKPEPSASFTERTMSKLVPVAEAPKPTASRFPWARIILGAGWAAALLLAGWAGHAVYRALTPREPTSPPDPRLAENTRLHKLAGDVEHLDEPDPPGRVTYANWLTNLPEADCASILDAPDGPARLKVVREIRDREWAARLPAKLKDELQALPYAQRGQRLAELREEERRQRLLWQKGTRSKEGPILRPSKLGELTPEARAFVEDLKARLSPDDKSRLGQAEGRWPDFPRAVRELAEAHPTLPPLPSGRITRWIDLPQETRKALNSLPQKGRMRKLPAVWPDYALEVARVISREKLTGPPLGASRLREFPEETRKFLESRLLPALPPKLKDELHRLEGRWPDFPRELVRLAKERNLLIPGMTLPPGPPEVWENVRLALPNVLDRGNEFAREEAKDAVLPGAP